MSERSDAKPVPPAHRAASASQRAARDRERLAQRQARKSGPGPGQYDLPSSIAWGKGKSTSQAPSPAFAKPTRRRADSPSAKQAASEAARGPGYYNPRRTDEIGQKTTFNTKGEKGSLSFGSRSSRGRGFDETALKTPGPGSYDWVDPRSIAVTTSANAALGKKSGTSVFRSAVPQHADLVELSTQKRETRPGPYQYNPPHDGQTGPSSAGKPVTIGRAPRFSNPSEKHMILLGPGEYEVKGLIGAQGDEAKRPSAAFASSSLRDTDLDAYAYTF
jgi:hypothetical protein